jgi:hypothetical protein
MAAFSAHFVTAYEHANDGYHGYYLPQWSARSYAARISDADVNVTSTRRRTEC